MNSKDLVINYLTDNDEGMKDLLWLALRRDGDGFDQDPGWGALRQDLDISGL